MANGHVKEYAEGVPTEVSRKNLNGWVEGSYLDGWDEVKFVNNFEQGYKFWSFAATLKKERQNKLL